MEEKCRHILKEEISKAFIQIAHLERLAELGEFDGLKMTRLDDW